MCRRAAVRGSPAGLAPLLNSGNAKPESRPAPVRAPESRPAPVRTPEVRAPAPPPASVLGPTLRFRGELSAQEDLIVQGSVEGSIAHTQSLTIGTNGSMTGDIRARFIVIEGTVEGDLIAAESVHVRATAKVRGNMLAPRIAIEDGAFFQGRVQMQPVAAANAAPLEAPAVDQMLSGTGT